MESPQQMTRDNTMEATAKVGPLLALLKYF